MQGKLTPLLILWVLIQHLHCELFWRGIGVVKLHFLCFFILHISPNHFWRYFECSLLLLQRDVSTSLIIASGICWMQWSLCWNGRLYLLQCKVSLSFVFWVLHYQKHIRLEWIALFALKCFIKFFFFPKSSPSFKLIFSSSSCNSVTLLVICHDRFSLLLGGIFEYVSFLFLDLFISRFYKSNLLNSTGSPCRFGFFRFNISSLSKRIPNN